MTINLLDVIKLHKPKPSNLAKDELDSLLAKRAATEAALQAISTAMNQRDANFSDEDRAAMRHTGKLLSKYHNQSETSLMTDFFHRSGALPSNAVQQEFGLEWNYSRGAQVVKGDGKIAMIDKFNQSPQVAIVDLLEISRIANMIIIPFDYLNPQSYKNESYDTRDSIASFRKTSIAANMQMYVICPLRHYSILEHLKAQDANMPIIANAFQQNFDVLGMMMPAMMMFSDKLQGMEGDIRQLYGRIDTLDASMKGVIRGMESMTLKLDALQATVEKQQLELIKSKTAIEEQLRAENTRQARNSEYAWYMAYEPLAFAVPRGTSTLDATVGYLGPCWGPDFDEIVAAALALNVRKGQRVKLEKVINQLW